MKVYVKVEGADGETFPLHTVRTKDELRRILDFARIGSQDGGSPRRVYRAPRSGARHQLIARYVDGESQSTKLMRARRNPLWGVAVTAGLYGLKKVLLG